MVDVEVMYRYGDATVGNRKEDHMATLKPIKKSDPPPMKRKGGPRGSKYDPIVEKLKDAPGEWFQVCTDVTTTTAKVFKDRGCETTTRQVEDSDKPNRVNVWARWPSVESSKPVRKAKPKKAPAKRTSAK